MATHNQFMFATGIENSYPNIILPDGTVKRVDEMAKAGHYDRWEEDFSLVKEMVVAYRHASPYGKRNGYRVFALRPALLFYV